MILQKLNELGIDLNGATSGTKKTWCPVCASRKGVKPKDKDLSVNIDQGFYKCHNSHCNFQGRVSSKEYKRPEWKPNLSGVPSDLRLFAESRGISQETIKKENVTFENGNIHFNYFKNEVLVNYKKRSIKEKHFSQFPEAEKVLYRYDSLKDKTKGIIVEGEIDALTWVELGFDSEYAIVSLDQGAGDKGVLDGKLECFSNAALLIDKITEWYLAGDNDAAGEYTFKEIGRRLGEYRCKKIDFGKHKDSNQKLTELIKSGLQKDLIAETFRRLISDAMPLPILGVQPLDNQMIEEMLDRYDNGIMDTGDGIGSSLDSYWTNLDGELTLFTGYPGEGKSQFFRFVAVNLAMKKGYKFACYCPEDNPASYFYEDLACIYMGKNINPKYPDRATRVEYLSALNFIRDKFFYIHPEPDLTTGMISLPDNKWINEKINFLKLQYGVNSYVKDPWNKIFHNIAVREDQYLAQELSNEKFFAGGYKGCFYVAHPKAPTPNRDGTIPEATQYTLSGGAQFNNMMDNIIIVQRPERLLDPASKRVQVVVKKIKKQRVRGGEGTVEMNFYKSTNRYEEAFDDMGFDNYSPKIDMKVAQESSPFDFGEVPF